MTLVRHTLNPVLSAGPLMIGDIEEMKHSHKGAMELVKGLENKPYA